MGQVREVALDIGGRAYVLASDDTYLDAHIGGFDPEMVKLFRAVASGSEAILDVGANIGCAALLFGGLSKVVHAFEPSPSTFAFLQRNVARSGLKNVFAHNCGLGDERGESQLTYSPTNRSGAYVSDQTQASSGHIVETIRLRRMDEVVSSLSIPKVDFIKIDVEGFEAHVLRGGEATLATCKPTVVLELNHWCLNAFQRTSVPDFFDFLRSRFPILLAVDGSCYLNLHNPNESYTVMYHHILRMRFLNILAAFDEGRIGTLRETYRHGFSG